MLQPHSSSQIVFLSDVPLSIVLARRGTQIRYAYDFGDHWHHTVNFEKIASAQFDTKYPALWMEPELPPEDCGGTSGVPVYLAVISCPA
jgi:hypothetical protein